MARNFVDFGIFDGFQHFFDNNLAESKLQGIMQGYRDKLRTALDSGGTGAQWSVSDILKWQGYNSYNFGYMFQVIHKDGSGIPTGHVWTWFWAIPTNDEPFPTMGKHMCLNNWTIIDDRFVRCNNSSSYIHDDYSPAVLYTPDYDRKGRFTGTESGTPTADEAWQLSGDSSVNGVLVAHNAENDWTIRLDAGRRLRAGDTIVGQTSGETLAISAITYDHCYDTGFTNHLTGTSSGADWAVAPIKSPYTLHDDFFMESPLNEQLFGVTFEGDNGLNDRWTNGNFAVVVDDTEPFMSFMWCPMDRPIVTCFALMGKILSPAKGADTFLSAVYYGHVQTSDWTDTRVTGQWCEAIYGDHPSGTPGSGRTTFDVRYTDRYTIQNERNAADEYIPDLYTIDNTNEVKGFINPDIAKYFGSLRSVSGIAVTDGNGNSYIRAARGVVLPFVTGESQWPSGIRFQNRVDSTDLR